MCSGTKNSIQHTPMYVHPGCPKIPHHLLGPSFITLSIKKKTLHYPDPVKSAVRPQALFLRTKFKILQSQQIQFLLTVRKTRCGLYSYRYLFAGSHFLIPRTCLITTGKNYRTIDMYLLSDIIQYDGHLL